MPGAADEAKRYLNDASGSRKRLDRVARLIEGFETPYGMELLATVHWVVSRDPAIAEDENTVVDRVRAWSQRKGDLFTRRHVGIAWRRLREHGWLPSPALVSQTP